MRTLSQGPMKLRSTMVIYQAGPSKTQGLHLVLFKYSSLLILSAFFMFNQWAFALENNVTIEGLSGSRGETLFFTLAVPENVEALNFSITGSNGDADLYVKYGSKPSRTNFDCRPYLNGSNEQCDITNIQSGVYHVMVRAYRSFNNLKLLGSFVVTEIDSDDPGNNSPELGTPSNPIELEKDVEINGLSGVRNAKIYFVLPLTADASDLKFTIFGGRGDADIYVQYNQIPSKTQYDCRPYKNGNNEVCRYDTALAGNYYIFVRAYSAFDNVSLIAEYNDGTIPPIGDLCMNAVSQALFDAHNSARSQGRYCGEQYFPTVPSLEWSCQLNEAATNHNIDMINNSFFSHTGSNGSSPGDRISNTGYIWRSYGENIAKGQQNVSAVMQSWLNSPGHCSNIMSANVTDMGASMIVHDSRPYWTSVFAKPQ